MGLREMVKQYLDADLRKKAAETEQKELKPELMSVWGNQISRGGEKTMKLVTDDWSGSVTYVPPTVLHEVDAAKLQELIDPELWEMITVPAVDSAKLKAAVELRQISADVMKQVTINKPREGYPRFTGHPVEKIETVDVAPSPKTTGPRRRLTRPVATP